MRVHWTDPDYGITDLAKEGYFIVKINYIDELSSETKIHSRASYYYTQGSRPRAKLKAIAIRDELLRRDDVKQYLKTVYAAPDRKDTRSRAKGNQGSTLPELPGISVSVSNKTLAGGNVKTYYAIRCAASEGFGKGFKSTSFSIIEHGLRSSLEKAVQWRCDRLGSAHPGAAVIQEAIKKIRVLYPDMPLKGKPNPKHDDSMQP